MEPAYPTYEEYLLKEAGIGDIEAVMAIEKRGFVSGIGEERQVFLDRIAAFPAGFLLLVESKSGKPVGYFASEIWRKDCRLDADLFFLNHDIRKAHDPAGELLYISSMSVLPERRGSGLGRFLFGSCVERLSAAFPGLEEAVLIVNETWTSARNIYAKEGFREISSLEGFFAPSGGARQAAIVMAKRLRPRPAV